MSRKEDVLEYLRANPNSKMVDIANGIKVSTPTASKEAFILQAEGKVTIERRGTAKVVSLC